MLVSCLICDDMFTGIHSESVHSTPCGHLFHQHCLSQWLKRAPTCPHCRAQVTEKQVIKLYFQNNSNLSAQDIPSLTNQVQDLTYKNFLKEKEIKNLKQENKKIHGNLAILKKHVELLDKKVQSHKSDVYTLQEHNGFLKKACKNSKLEAEKLRKDLFKYQSFKVLQHSTRFKFNFLNEQNKKN